MRKTWILASAATAGLLLTGFGVDRLVAADDKVPSIEDIMKKVNKQKGGLHSQVGTALKAATVDWDTVQKKTKEYAALAERPRQERPAQGQQGLLGQADQEIRRRRQGVEHRGGKEGQDGRHVGAFASCRASAWPATRQHRET